jgi:hypothetical protein
MTTFRPRRSAPTAAATSSPTPSRPCRGGSRSSDAYGRARGGCGEDWSEKEKDCDSGGCEPD